MFKVLMTQYSAGGKKKNPAKQWAQVHRGQLECCLYQTKDNGLQT